MRRKMSFLIDLENQLASRPSQEQGRGSNNKKISRINRDFENIFGRKSSRKSLFSLEEKITPEKKPAVESKTFDLNQPFEAQRLREQSVPWAKEALKSPSIKIEAFEEPVKISSMIVPESTAQGQEELNEIEMLDTADQNIMPPEMKMESMSEDEPVPDIEEIEADVSFAKDLEDVLSQKKVFQPGLNVEESQEKETISPRPPANPYAIFDSIAEGLEHATTFDLGTIPVQADFDAFDKIIETEDTLAQTEKSRGNEINTAQELSEMDIIEDFAFIQELKSKEKDKKAEAGRQFPEKVFEKAEQKEGMKSPDKTEQAAPAAGKKDDTKKEDKKTDSKISMEYKIPVIPEKKELSSWAACVTSLLCWRDEVEVNPDEMIQGDVKWKLMKDKLMDRDIKAFIDLGVKNRPRKAYSVKDLQNDLENLGPLIAAKSEKDPHPRLITGLKGSGSNGEYSVLIVDPWEKGMSVFTSPNKGDRYWWNFSAFDEWQRLSGKNDKSEEGLITAFVSKKEFKKE